MTVLRGLIPPRSVPRQPFRILFRRKPESGLRRAWTPAFAGVTVFGGSSYRLGLGGQALYPLSVPAPIIRRPMSEIPATPAAASGSRSNAVGILLMVLAVGLFGAMNLFVRMIGPDYHALEAVFFRNVIATALVLPFILGTGGLGTLKTKRPLGHAFRALAGMTGNLCYFSAFQLIPLADGQAISMSVPIVATLLAIPLLGERVGWHRWLAILVGFCGVLVAMNPGGTIGTGSLFALAGTVCWAFTIIFVRMLSTTEKPYTIVFYYMVTGSLVATLFMPWVWVTPTPRILLLYLGAGLVGGVAQIAMTFSLKMAPASVVSPFEYTSIVWAVLFDLAVMGDAPVSTTLIGAAIVVASGLYIYHRESRPKHRGEE
jgi:drug/metabolite transporter (DMT)-like permease